MKTPRKFGISSCLAYLSSSKLDSGLSRIAISNTCILHGRVLTKLVHLRQSYISRSRPPSGTLDSPPSAPGGRGRGPAGAGKSMVKKLKNTLKQVTILSSDIEKN